MSVVSRGLTGDE